MSAPLLQVRGLVTEFRAEALAGRAVDSVSFDVAEGEIVGLVGESGSGKSVTGFSIMGLVDPPGRVIAGSVRFKGRELIGLPEPQMRKLRGDRIAMVFQDPLATLNPTLRIDVQIVEAIREHAPVPRAEALARAEAALARVGIPDPAARLHAYPHELSGGMRQRVAIAIALVNNPDLLIADEPTTALDVTIQGQILAQMQELRAQVGAALIWITHDLGVIAGLADRVAVMYAGRIVETGTVDAVLDAPRHPYTQGLIRSVPGATEPGAKLQQIPGMAPSLFARPRGCAFRARCDRAVAACAHRWPDWTAETERRGWLCHNPVAAA